MSGLDAQPVSVSVRVRWCDSSESISGVINRAISAEPLPCQCQQCPCRADWTIKSKQPSFQEAGNLSSFSLAYQAGLSRGTIPVLDQLCRRMDGESRAGFPGILWKVYQLWMLFVQCCQPTFMSQRSRGCMNCSDGFLKLVATSLS